MNYKSIISGASNAAKSAAKSSVWSNLVYTAEASAGSLLLRLARGYLNKDQSGVQYKAPRAYNSAIIFTERRKLTNEALKKVNNYISSQQYLRQLKQLQARQSIAAEKSKTLIADGVASIDGGSLALNMATGGTYTYIAEDYAGRRVNEAMFLHYEVDDPYTFTVVSTDTTYTITDGVSTTASTSCETKLSLTTMFHVDLAPTVSLNSDKNIVQTQVQGRDYSRKELVSGGDLSFTVKGEINSGKAGVYPSSAVARFIQIMQYSGIIQVDHFMFSNLNVKNIIIKGYDLEMPTYKNIQPYSFTCVAIEPDEDVIVSSDTISFVNETIASNNQTAWYDKMMQSKYGQIANGIMESATEASLGALLDTIPQV
jgi:hypothetical protein